MTRKSATEAFGTGEAARRYKVCRKTVNNWLRVGVRLTNGGPSIKLQGEKTGRNWRTTQAHLDSFMRRINGYVPRINHDSAATAPSAPDTPAPPDSLPAENWSHGAAPTAPSAPPAAP